MGKKSEKTILSCDRIFYTCTTFILPNIDQKKEKKEKNEKIKFSYFLVLDGFG